MEAEGIAFIRIRTLIYKSERDPFTSVSSRPSTKVRQIEVLNGKRFHFIAAVVRLAPDLIAKVTVAHLIPFIVKIPPLPEVFFLMARCRSREGVSTRGVGFPSCTIRIIVSLEGEKRESKRERERVAEERGRESCQGLIKNRALRGESRTIVARRDRAENVILMNTVAGRKGEHAATRDALSAVQRYPIFNTRYSIVSVHVRD